MLLLTVMALVVCGVYTQLPVLDPCVNSPCAPDERCVASANTTGCTSPPCPSAYECRNVTRQGECPAITPEVQPDFALCVDHCTHDIDCPTDQKCCRSSCGARICLNAAEKTGTCPSMETSYIGLCVAQCKTDNDCSGIQKCCGGCPRKCVEPVNQTAICDNMKCPDGYECTLAPVICKTSPCYPIVSCLVRVKYGKGMCPERSFTKSDVCRNECGVDGQCPRDELCCQVGCNRVCSIPTRNKKGKCPRRRQSNIALMISRIGPCRPECSNDDECPGDKKCCGLCGKCTDPVASTKPGKCPDSFFNIFPMFGLRLNCRGRKHCSTDADCPGRRKCCGDCPRKCKKPKQRPTSSSSSSSVKTRLKCPTIVHVINCQRSRVKKCVADSNCRKKSKCCPSLTCGKVCVRIIRPKSFWGRR